MSRFPILTRLTVAFALAMLVMLSAAAAFVALRLRADLDDRINASLDARATAAAAAIQQDHSRVESVPLDDPEETFVQVLDLNGAVLAQVGTAASPSVTTADIARAGVEPRFVLERDVAGVDGRARILVQTQGAGPDRVVIATGQSLIDRDEAVASVLRSFGWGGLASVVLASIVGYAVARGGLAPVEAMRLRAESITLSGAPDTLPLPRAQDQLFRLGQTLNEMLARNSESFERERRFVADASHEIRTPLAVIRTELEAALYAGHLPPEARAALVAAHDECLRLGRLADDLLVLARVADGHLPLRPRNLDLGNAIAAVRDLFADSAAEQGRFVAIEIPPGLSVMADPDRLRQLITNLMDNALRHGSGSITATAQPVEGGAQLTIVDQGPGLADAYADHAFERFSRGNTSRPRQGAGLGLSLVSAIAEAHGGRAWVSTSAPRSVRVWLPGP